MSMSILDAAMRGRNGDTMMAHVTPGEKVIPREIAALRPDLVAHVENAIKQQGGDPSKYTVGAGRVNPQTGAQEFATEAEVQAAYQSQLGRAADPGGLNFWMNNDAGFHGADFANDVNKELANRPKLSPTTVTAAVAPTIGAPTAWDVTPNQTVAGQVATITNPNDPLMVQAKTQANEDANRRGLVNSSIATTAGQDAMYRAALPIATADAATYGKAAGYNADQINQVAVKNADLKSQIAQANLGANTSLVNAALGASTTRDVASLNADSAQKMATMQSAGQQNVATMNADSQQRIATMDAASRAQVQQLQNQNQQLLTTSGQAATAFNQYVVSATNIQNNPNLDAASKTSALQTLWQTTQTQLQVLSHVSGLDLTSQLDMTAFNAPTPTAAPVGIVAGEAGPVGGA